MLDPTLRLSRERAGRGREGPGWPCSFSPSRRHHPISSRACLSLIPARGDSAHAILVPQGRVPQSPSSACSTWKASDFWWPDDPSLPSMSRTGTGTRGGKATHSGPAEHGPLHPKPSAATPPSGQERAGRPEGQQQEHPQTRGMGLAGLTEEPTVHTSKGGTQGPAKQVASRGCSAVSSLGPRGDRMAPTAQSPRTNKG